MPAAERGWNITADELRSWVIDENEELVAVNKPALVVCHPSKHGPWSSLAGACREYFGLDRARLPFRLDRETSGVVVIAKTAPAAARLQGAVWRCRLRKVYRAILYGHLESPVRVNRPIGPDRGSGFSSRRVVSDDGQPAETEFIPEVCGGGYTLARVHPRTGRMHQIRVHAAWLGHPVLGGKLYPDPSLMLDFLKEGFSPRLAAQLVLRRQALHAGEVVFVTDRGEERFQAPPPADLTRFVTDQMGCRGILWPA